MTKSIRKTAEELQYSLRSSFFYRRRGRFKSWVEEVKRVSRARYEWGDLDKLGISDTAWRRAQSGRLAAAMVFCHPEIIASRPGLVGYYRCIAALPQKATQRLAFGTGPLEEGKTSCLSPQRALVLTKLFNSRISAIIESEAEFSLTDAQLVGMMNFGAQINGSWRNAIGTEGGERVKRLLLTHLCDRQLVSSIVSKSARRLRWPLSDSQFGEVQRAVLANGYELVFGSEPDVSILDNAGTLQAAIEVKYGLDPAGALERYGAAKKSFDKALQLNKSTETIYLASCITSAVRKRIKTDRLVRRDFDLTRVFLDRKQRDKFLNHITWLIRL